MLIRWNVIFVNNSAKEGIIGDENSAGMVTSLHLMLASALQHIHTALLHLSPLPTIYTYQSRWYEEDDSLNLWLKACPKVTICFP